MKNIPENSNIQADMLPSFSTWEKLTPGFNYNEGWGNFNMINYVLLEPNTDVVAFSNRAKDLYNQHAWKLMKQWGVKATFRLLCLQDKPIDPSSPKQPGDLLASVWLLNISLTGGSLRN